LLLHVWCKDCRHRVDLDPAEQAERHGPDLPDARLDGAAELARNVAVGGWILS